MCWTRRILSRHGGSLTGAAHSLERAHRERIERRPDDMQAIWLDGSAARGRTHRDAVREEASRSPGRPRTVERGSIALRAAWAASSARVDIPSLAKTCPRCTLTVPRVTNSRSAVHRGRRRVRSRLPEARRTRDVGQHERDRAGGHTPGCSPGRTVAHHDGLLQTISQSGHGPMFLGREGVNICHLAYAEPGEGRV